MQCRGHVNHIICALASSLSTIFIVVGICKINVLLKCYHKLYSIVKRISHGMEQIGHQIQRIYFI